GVYLPAGSASYTLYSEAGFLAGSLVWDPAASCSGDNWHTNTSPAGGDFYFKIHTPGSLPAVWRTFLGVTSGEADLYLAQGYLPTPSSYTSKSELQGPDEVLLANDQFGPNQDWFILVHGTPGAQWRLLTGEAYIEPLAWDPGLTHQGTLVFTNSCDAALSRLFKITTQNSSAGAWRTALNVEQGEADLFLRQGSLPSTTSYNFRSDAAGSDGFVLHSSQFSAGQDWYLLVRATAGAQWNLVSGEVYVHDLGLLAVDSTSSASVVCGAEGMAFFKTTVPADTLAWRLGLNGASQTLRVRKSAVPHPVSFVNGEPLPQAGQMLIAPNFLSADTFNGYYFVGLEAAPGTLINLDSRKQMVTDIAFNSTNAPVTVTDYGYRTYRVQVPVQQIAWEVRVLPLSGDPNLAVRRGAVPNEWNNDAFSEVPGTVTDSLTLVPPALADGTFFVTVYGTGSYSFTLQSGNPVVTDVPYFGANTNDDLNRVGWRFYRVPDIASQLGPLGWELRLQNQPPGTQLALRRNAVPGQWSYRNNYSSAVGSSSFVDVAAIGSLQQPAHQADIWYIGIYNPADALGAFRLLRQELVPEAIAFDGVTVAKANVPAGTWQFFQVEVPPEALGWDLRLVNVTSGTPKLVVRRDQLPSALRTDQGWAWPGYLPWTSSSWPSGLQWMADADWTYRYRSPVGADERGRLLALGLGNPLEAGTYYVGVLNDPDDSSPMSYSLLSRGIGSGLSLPVTDLDFAAGSRTNSALAPREAAYYRVTIPTNVSSWKLDLRPTSGEALLLVQKDALPNTQPGSGGSRNWYARSALTLQGGKLMEKAGHDHYTLLPPEGQTNLPAGLYYVAVVSEGVGSREPNGWSSGDGWMGTNTSSYVLESKGQLAATQLGTLGATDLVYADALEGGELKAYHYLVPAGVASLEVRLEQVVGSAALAVRPGAELPDPNVNNSPYAGYYGAEGGQSNGRQTGWNIVTMVNPSPGLHSLTVKAENPDWLDFAHPDTTYRLRLRAVPPTELSFSGNENANGKTNTASGLLADNQRAFFQIEVPASNPDASPVIGWRLELSQTQGSASLRLRKGTLPRDGVADQTPFISQSATLVAPYLAPGTWYLEVRASGATSFTLTSRTLIPNRLWALPEPGQPSATPGLVGLECGDTGTDTNGNAVLDPQTGTVTDRGIDLEQGRVDYYAFTVPTNNVGLFRTVLEAISGNPDLFLRYGAPPTLSHGATGGAGTLFDRSQTATTTEYGNWVPIDGRYESRLAPGYWYLAVQAAGNSNARYRLHTFSGNIQDLALTNGSFASQTLLGGDWRYYRVQVPFDAPADWNLSFSQQSGDVVLYLRDTVPPGLGLQSGDLHDWQSDSKNYGLHPNWDPPGTYSLHVPPVRPGHTYYLGFRALNDATFSVSSATAGAVFATPVVIPFYRGYVTNVLPPNAQVLYRVDVPADALGWNSYAVHSDNVILYLEQGTIPLLPPSGQHYRSYGANSHLSQSLCYPNNWPWIPGQSYFLLAVNSSSVPQPFRFAMNGLGTSAPPLTISPASITADGSFQFSAQVAPG
ncbi:MAG TPA: hypothetical protein VNT26_16390, partial [Candidatus Sulfotelmatobacter sp.]|nr:hypothetical protein [Candidatus Sulfotelmatobacter sp.]